MSVRRRICVNCENSSFSKVDKNHIKCNQCGLVTDIRRNERFREKKKKAPKEERRAYEPVTVTCQCGVVLVKGMKNPWSEEKEKLKKRWEEHYCKEGVTKEDLRYM